MGRDLANAFPVARAVFEEADEALGFALSKLCFEGPDEELKLTENTQPAILTCSIAVLAAVREKGVEADFVAGHSLGEYSALVAAGALQFADACVDVVYCNALDRRGRHGGSAGHAAGRGRSAL